MSYEIDSRWIDRDGWTVRLHLEPDYDANYDGPEGMGDGYTPRQVKAFKADEWGYCILVAVAYRHGFNPKLGFASLGGVEYGHFLITDEDDNGNEWRDLNPLEEGNGYVDELAQQAIDDAVETLRGLCASLNAGEIR